MTLINILLLSLIVVFIVDISGVMDSLRYFIWKTFAKGVGDWRTLQLKPFTCSLCMTFWTGLLYLLLTGQFTLPYIAFVCLLSLLSSRIADFEQYITDLADTVIEFLYKITNRQ